MAIKEVGLPVLVGLGLEEEDGVVKAVDLDRGVQISVAGFELDASEAAGTGLEQDPLTSWYLRLAAQGNGIAGGAGSLLSVQADETTGGDVVPVQVTANGVGLDVGTIAGTGLVADGAGNLDLDVTSTLDLTGATWTFSADQLRVSGTPTIPTAAANRSYVDSLSVYTVRNVSTSPVVSVIQDALLADTTSTAISVTLPAGTSALDGRSIRLKLKVRGGSNDLTILPQGSDTIEGAASLVISTEGEAVELVYDHSNTRWERW